MQDRGEAAAASPETTSLGALREQLGQTRGRVLQLDRQEAELDDQLDSVSALMSLQRSIEDPGADGSTSRVASLVPSAARELELLPVPVHTMQDRGEGEQARVMAKLAARDLEMAALRSSTADTAPHPPLPAATTSSVAAPTSATEATSLGALREQLGQTRGRVQQLDRHEAELDGQLDNVTALMALQRSILVREGYISRVASLVRVDGASRGGDTGAGNTGSTYDTQTSQGGGTHGFGTTRLVGDAVLKVLNFVDLIRMVTVDITEGLERIGRRELMFQDEDYVCKMEWDLDFLDAVDPVKQALGFSLLHNPLLIVAPSSDPNHTAADRACWSVEPDRVEQSARFILRGHSGGTASATTTAAAAASTYTTAGGLQPQQQSPRGEPEMGEPWQGRWQGERTMKEGEDIARMSGRPPLPHPYAQTIGEGKGGEGKMASSVFSSSYDGGISGGGSGGSGAGGAGGAGGNDLTPLGGEAIVPWSTLTGALVEGRVRVQLMIIQHRPVLRKKLTAVASQDILLKTGCLSETKVRRVRRVRRVRLCLCLCLCWCGWVAVSVKKRDEAAQLRNVCRTDRLLPETKVHLCVCVSTCVRKSTNPPCCMYSRRILASSVCLTV